MRKNDDIQLNITGMTADGSGVGRVDGMAVFVPQTVPGESVTAHVIKVQKNYAIAKLVSVENPSPDRIEEDCEVGRSCGGCCYRHLSYEAEKKAKYQRVVDAFRRIGGLDVTVEPLVGAPAVNGYRNKAQYPVGLDQKGNPVFGFYANHTHRVVPCKHCHLQPEFFDAILETISEWMKENRVPVYDETAHRGLVRHVYLRYAETTGEVLVLLVINGKSVPHEQDLVTALREVQPSIVGIGLNINELDTNVVLGNETKWLFGRNYMMDELGGIRVKISPMSFYQVNHAMAEKLYQKAAEFADADGAVLVDLYCGAGTIGLSMAQKAKQLIGVEIVPQAVEDAEFNAEENGIHNAEFICADATEAAKQLAKRGISADVVIVDPPRKGCTPELIHTIAKEFDPKRVVYVSCDPATLARDAKLFDELGYRVQSIVPFDLFPRTLHVETVCLLTRMSENVKKLKDT